MWSAKDFIRRPGSRSLSPSLLLFSFLLFSFFFFGPTLSLCRLTITSNDEELVVVTHLVHHDIRVGRDNLLLGRELGALLELEITNGS